MTAAKRPGLLRDPRGVTVIEFAFLAPIVSLMIVGMTDLARGVAAKLTLNQAVYRALEKVQVGTVQSDYDFLKPDVAAGAGVPQSAVTVTATLRCNGVERTPFTETCEPTQTTSRYVQIDVTSSYQPLFPTGIIAGRAGTNPNGSIPLTASSSLRIQ